MPYTDEITAIRKHYGISSEKMSLILGFGVNQYRLYEQGEVPSVSNGRMIRSIFNPMVMLDLIESSRHELSASEYKKNSDKINIVLGEKEQQRFEAYELKCVYAAQRGLNNGFAPLSLSRLENAMLYLLAHCEDVWFTKMNKLLFYTDFLSYRENGIAITGLSYKAIDYGPVPERWNVVYSEFPSIHQELHGIGDYVGSYLTTACEADLSLFSDSEVKVLDKVCETFHGLSSRELSDLSHEENAWINHHLKRDSIPFEEAFSLKRYSCCSTNLYQYCRIVIVSLLLTLEGKAIKNFG